ncbi:hypothetical protein IWQ60_003487 [Tieghemiomyces parasiticus]|uniref:Uncharacterized protein n=1 Tax=Tieghemiomyces parasiticus TaxID=78921 RepID=A0A9W8AA40_9FUNG|nr:hypothetical protein IWQ60_003487 [Tieghemiomyces parasiticus]
MANDPNLSRFRTPITDMHFQGFLSLSKPPLDARKRKASPTTPAPLATRVRTEKPAPARRRGSTQSEGGESETSSSSATALVDGRSLLTRSGSELVASSSTREPRCQDRTAALVPDSGSDADVEEVLLMDDEMPRSSSPTVEPTHSNVDETGTVPTSPPEPAPVDTIEGTTSTEDATDSANPPPADTPPTGAPLGIRDTILYLTSRAQFQRNLDRYHDNPQHLHTDIEFVEDQSPPTLVDQYRADAAAVFRRKLKGLLLGIDFHLPDALRILHNASGDWDVARQVLWRGPAACPGYSVWTPEDDRTLCNATEYAVIHALIVRKGSGAISRRLEYLARYYQREMNPAARQVLAELESAATAPSRSGDATAEESGMTASGRPVTVGLLEARDLLDQDPFVAACAGFVGTADTDTDERVLGTATAP